MTKSVQNIFWNIYAKIRNNTTTTDRIYFCLVTVKRLRVESDAGTRCSLGSGWSLAPWSARTDLNKYAFFWKPEPVSESEVKMPWQRMREWTRRGVRETHPSHFGTPSSNRDWSNIRVKVRPYQLKSLRRQTFLLPPTSPPPERLGSPRSLLLLDLSEYNSYTGHTI